MWVEKSYFLNFVTCKECFVLNSDLTQELKVFSTSVEAQQQLESIPQHHIMAESVINSGTKGGRVMSVSEFQVVEEYFDCFDTSNCLVNSYQGCILLSYLIVISSKFIQKFAQKCQYFTLIDQSVSLDNFYITFYLRTNQLCL